MANMPRESFNLMRHFFRHKMSICSEYVIIRQISIETGIDPVLYDCCIKICVAYTGDKADLDKCPECNEPRYDASGKARRVFCYISLIAQLAGLYKSEELAKLMRYRANFNIQGPDVIRDVFDGELYRKLIRHRVVVDGVKQDHKYFEGPHDVAFSVVTDSFLIYNRRRGGPSCTPILVLNHNLPPTIRTHAKNVICVGLIPGPTGPKDLASFRLPLEEELAVLAGRGVKAYNAFSKSTFLLRGYDIAELGDMVALEKALNHKGHNAYCPCRRCKLTGIRGNSTVYYIPLRIPKDYEQVERPGPRDLPARTHNSFARAVERMEAADTVAEKDMIGMATGIRGRPCFGQRVGSIDHSKSVPLDWMHLFPENIVQNLMKFWKGEYKGLDVGTGDYEIAPEIWEEIGKETVAAVPDLPATFVRSLKNVDSDSSYYTAEAWGFWFIYLAPVLLRGRLEPKYYQHMCGLVDIMKTTLKYSITSKELDELDEKIIDWVQKYEKWVNSVPFL